MTRNTWLGLIFLTFVILITLHKQLLWIFWKYKRLKIKEQAFDLLSSGGPFTEIRGPAQVGKSWLLSHLFKQLEGVKFTNLPTPNNIYTLNQEILQAHMLSKWGVPHRWYYFLDDLTTFQTWTKNKLGEQGYSRLQEYIGQVAKLGGVLVWTNNGMAIDPIFEVNKNATWKVQWHYSFSERYSLLAIRTSECWYKFLPTILAIDNKEIARFYDKFWNIPKENQANFLEYTTEEMGAKELDAIIKVIKDTNSELDFNNETVKLLLAYTKTKNSEARKVRDNKRKKEKLHQDLKDFGLNPSQQITPKQIDQWDKQGKFKYLKDKEASQGKDKKFNKSNPTELTDINLADLDLDMIKQDPHEETNND